MARAKKMHIKTVKHPHFHLEVDITLEEGSDYFRAKVLDSQLGAHTVKALEAEILGRLEVLADNLYWNPVIRLQLMDEGVAEKTHKNQRIDASLMGAGMSMKFERFYLAAVREPDDGLNANNRGSWSGKLSASWDGNGSKIRRAENCYIYFTDLEGAHEQYKFPGDKDGKIILPSRIRNSYGWTGSRVYLLDHTEAVWTTLRAIAQNMHKTRDQLNELVSTKKNIAMLEGFGVQLLAGGQLPLLPSGKKKKN